MKIHELSNYSKINPETIRLYRQKGLLRPHRNPANGYYEYSEANLISLFFVRILRGSNLPLQTIAQVFANESVSEMLNNIDNEIAGIEQQINSLEKKLDTMRLNRDHLAECLHVKGQIIEMASSDDKYDILALQHLTDPLLDIWLRQPELCTISLVINKDILNQELPVTPIAVTPAFGIYRMQIDQYKLPLPDYISVCPKGFCLSLILELDSLTELQPELLKPLQQYARQHGLYFASNTTAFLIRIDYSRPQTRYLFRLRVRAEELT